MRFLKRRRRLNLALQGGGAHGAYTWGVIDRLLADERISLSWVSGTSAGALNAVGLASGLTTGGPDGARAALAGLWRGVAQAAVPDFVRFNPFFSTWSRSPAVAQMASLFAPHELNPLGFDPLREVLETHIDFEAIRTRSELELIIAATDVRTGKAQLFSRPELTIEAVLASCCLPALHRAVEINGDSYWDGGFSANPDVIGLAQSSPCRDTLIVQLTPLKRPDVPTGAHAISDHVYHLTFLAPLIHDIEKVEICRQATSRAGWRLTTNDQGPGRIAAQRFHVIDATAHTRTLDWSSKVNPDWTIFEQLFEAGRADTETWLAEHFNDIGRRDSVDLQRHFLERADVPDLPLPKAPNGRNGHGHDEEAGGTPSQDAKAGGARG